MRYFSENAAREQSGAWCAARMTLGSIFLIAAISAAASGQTGLFSTPSPTPTSSSSPVASGTPIPVTAIVNRADAAKATLKESEDFASGLPSNFDIQAGIPQMQQRLAAGKEEVSALLQGQISLDELNTLERSWTSSQSGVEKWKVTLASQAGEVEKRIQTLSELNQLWESTRKELSGAGKAVDKDANFAVPPNTSTPDDVLRIVNETIFSIRTTQKLLEQKRSDLVALQTRVSDVDGAIDSVVASIKDRRARDLSRLFVRDSPPIWDIGASGITVAAVYQNGYTSLTERFDALRRYVAENPGGFFGHALVLLLLALGFGWAGRKIVPMVENEPKLDRAANIFRLPIASAFIVSVFVSSAFYTQPPKLLLTILGAAMMIPVIFLLRRLIDRHLLVIVYSLVGFYFFDRIREALSGLEWVNRSLFLVEMLAAAAFFLWFARSRKLRSRVDAASFKAFEIIRKFALAAGIVFVVAFVANLFGFANLSNILGAGPLAASYAGLALFTAYEIAKGLIAFLLRVKPLSSLRMVKTHRTVVRLQFTRIIRWMLIILWVIALLRAFSISDSFIAFLRRVFSTETSMGSITISLGDVVLFAIVVWVAFLASRFLRFILQEDVYPRVGVSGGVSYAISTMVHYVILILGFLVAVAALGFQLSQFAFIVGAVGIGVGFGLQNIINNFVSGIILLAERPVKVGDTVQIGEHQGKLSQIGLRASVLRKVDGSDVIVPNSHLISEEVINWTMADDKRRIEIPVGVAYGTDPTKVLELLSQAADEDENILKEPKPRAIFVEFGESSLNFELRAWTENSDDWVPIRSNLVRRVLEEFTAAGIEMPFPQRDLNVRSVDEKILKGLKASNETVK